MLGLRGRGAGSSRIISCADCIDCSCAATTREAQTPTTCAVSRRRTPRSSAATTACGARAAAQPSPTAGIARPLCRRRTAPGSSPGSVQLWSASSQVWPPSAAGLGGWGCPATLTASSNSSSSTGSSHRPHSVVVRRRRARIISRVLVPVQQQQHSAQQTLLPRRPQCASTRNKREAEEEDSWCRKRFC